MDTIPAQTEVKIAPAEPVKGAAVVKAAKVKAPVKAKVKAPAKAKAKAPAKAKAKAPAKVKVKAPAKAKVKAPAKSLSAIKLDVLKKLISGKTGSTVPKLMKALKQPRINVARALVRLSKVKGVKVKSVRADHVPGRPGQRPFIYTLG